MWQDLWAALGLMLVLEGIMPFLNPEGMRRVLRQMSELDNRMFRLGGLGSMLLGLIVLYFAR